MIVKLEQDLSLNDIEILIRFGTRTKDAERIASMLASFDTLIKCSLEGSEKLVNASDIYYFESVDKRTFVYCKHSVYRTGLRLYQLAADLENLGFVQINKSCVLNTNMLDEVRPLLNSRMEATLKNGERLYITRKYLDAVKQVLQEGL